VSAETALAHPGLIGQHVKRKVVGKMRVDPVMKRTEFVLCRLQRQGSAELCLSARKLEEDNQITSNGERHGAA
jgi:hypothetical protein